MTSKNPKSRNKKLSLDCSLVCRGCLKEFGAVNDSVYLFDDFPNDNENSTESQTISEIFSDFTLLKVYKFDKISQYICNECYQQLINFHRFRINCTNSYNELLKQKALAVKCYVNLQKPEVGVSRVSIKEERDDEVSRRYDESECEEQTVGIERIETEPKCELNEEDTDFFDVNSGNYASESSNDSVDELFNSNQNTIPLKHDNEADAKIDVVFEAEENNQTQDEDEQDSKRQRNLKYLCTRCPKAFFMQHRLDAHLRQHDGLKPFGCDRCDKAFTKWTRYKRHYAIKHPVDEFPHPSKNDRETKDRKRDLEFGEDDAFEKSNCSICNKGFTKKHRYEAHMRMHQGLSEYACDICGKEFTKSTTFKRHMQFKHEQADQDAFETYTCGVDDCGKTYTYKGSLRQHIIFYHLKRPKKKWDARNVICDQCGKAFGSRIALKVHLYTHADKSFQCHICSKYYTTPHNLNEHIKRHQGIKNHECNVCGLKTVTTSELRKHMNSHTREREFKCPMCSLVFLTVSQMNIHIKVVHYKVKDYHCQHCGQSFGRARTLKHHIMTHTGERPFQCEVCHKKFIQITALKTHMRTHDRKLTSYDNYSDIHQSTGVQ